MENYYLTEILILLAATIIAVPLFQRLGLGSVLGYLSAGAVIGPWGLGFISEVEDIRHIAEFGVVFLLFIIGIEISPARLKKMRKMVFGLGTAQLVVTGIAISGVSLLFGFSPKTSIIIGFGLALSSTAFGLQILTERGEMGTVHGNASFSVLLLQDLAVVPLLTLVLLLAADNTALEGATYEVAEAVIVIAAVILFGRYFLSPILRLVATHGTAEVFTAAAVLAVLGTAWLMEEAGLSLALGAFLAGLMMADSQYRHQVVADIEPFRGILLGLFFMGVGMSIDFGLISEYGVLIVAVVAGLLSVKAAILWALCRLARIPRVDSARVALLLSQSGEFGFVLFGLASANGLLDDGLFQLLTLVVATTMITTPLMANLGHYLNERAVKRARRRHDVSVDHLDASLPHVIIAGFGRVGRRVAKILMARSIPYVAIESDADRVLEGRRNEFEVFYGDSSQIDVLKAAGAGNARALVCTLDNVVPAVRLVSVMRQEYPDVTIYARGRDSQHCDQLRQAGASVAISETLESSIQIGGTVLVDMGVEEEDAAAVLEAFRKDYYR
ncbi:MAG: transporter [Proteobacteria bacterium]|nr:MAG: transporter [Pseudomonadota bacterium]